MSHLHERRPRSVWDRALPILSIPGLWLAACVGSVGAGDPEQASDIGAPRSRGAIGPGPGTSAGTTPPNAVIPGFAPARPRLVRLTRLQIENTIGQIFGKGLDLPTTDADMEDDGFVSVGASQVVTSPQGIEQFAELADSVAVQVTKNAARRSTIVPCQPSGAADRDCAVRLLSQLGRLVFRRPLGAEEIDRYVRVWQAGATAAGDFWTGVRFIIAGLLQSPSFLYRWESGDPNTGRYDDHGVASRLAFFLTNAAPDAELLEQAKAGTLRARDGIARAAERLLGLEGSRAALRQFFVELFRLHKLDGLTLDAKRFPSYSPTLGASMKEETLRVIEDLVFTANGDYGALFEQTSTFLNSELAKIYQVPAPAGGGFTKVSLPEGGPRSGILTHPAFLASTSSDGETKPMVRGRVIRERFLCQPVPDPPKAETLPPPKAGQNATKRERLAVHRTQPACAGCHSLLDPPGLALENFDAVGAYRKTESDGSVIDARGDLDGVTFDGARGLGQVLRRHERLASCLATLLYRVAASHREETGEAPAIGQLATEFEKGGRRIGALLLSIVTSEAFTTFARTAP